MGWLKAHNSNQQLYISETLTSPTQLLQKKKKIKSKVNHQSRTKILYMNHPMPPSVLEVGEVGLFEPSSSSIATADLLMNSKQSAIASA